ncbi:hypothetical protein JOB18_016446 [Solea senegalensis]|uniref:Uncharacterized protein n=2 Tax=Solea senegalensis TaxID=28829 RepID=A0AAV6ST60_SOLSE|nr:hypothetical protein JOB18_016446 [Solea senegalensis]
MAEKLQQYKFDGQANANSQRVTRTTRQHTPRVPNQPLPTRPGYSTMDAEDIKKEVLSSLRGEISKIIRNKLKSALTDDFNALKLELQGMRSEVANNMKAMWAEVDHIKTDIQDMKGGLSTWSDEVTSLQTTVSSLKNQVATLKDRCEDMEGRMRRGNIRIAAWDGAPLSYNGHHIGIFPDYTASVAKARAAFTDVRKALRGRKEIRYGLFYPARLRITHQDEDKEFVDPQKAMDYVKKILPATEIEG